MFFGFCCGLPLLIVYYTLLFRLRKGMLLPGGLLLLGAILPMPFVGLASYGEGRYVLLDEAIVEAGCQGDTATIDRLVAWGADPNKPDDNEGYTLPCAVGNRHVAAARALLRHGADPRLGGLFGVSRNLAAQSDDPAMRRLFGLPVKAEKAR